MKKVLFLVLVLIATSMTNIFAMTPTYPNNAKYSRGVGNCCYYIDGSASGYTNQINSGVNNWVDTGYGWNPIYMTPVSSNYGTHMDFYARTPQSDAYLNEYIAAYTTFWNTDGSLVTPKTAVPTYNYFYTEMIYNLSTSGSYDDITTRHEMGHSFGLSHTENEYSIMFPNLGGIAVSTVQQCDNDTVNFLYN